MPRASLQLPPRAAASTPPFQPHTSRLTSNSPPTLLQDGGDYEAAERYYTRLLDFGAGSKEAAKSSLREIRTLKAAGVVPRGPPPAGGVGGGGLTPVRPDSPPDSPGSDMMAGMSPY